jgi:hypothetical protein
MIPFDLTIGILLCAIIIANFCILESPRPCKRSYYYRSVKISYSHGAVDPWPGLEEALDIIADEMKARFPAYYNKLMDFTIEVVGYTGYCIGCYHPTGRVLHKGELHRINSTLDVRNLFSFRPTQYVIVVRQLRRGDSLRQNGLARGQGDFKSAGRSIIFFLEL